MSSSSQNIVKFSGGILNTLPQLVGGRLTIPVCVGIKSIVFNEDYTFTINLTDGSSYTSPVLRGEDGVSPEVSISEIEGGHTITITDIEHPEGQSFNVMDGAIAYYEDETICFRRVD